MTKESLIDKLESLKNPVPGSEQNFVHNTAIDACIAIIRQHTTALDVVGLVNELIEELDYDCSNWRNILASDFKTKWKAAIAAMGDASTRKDEVSSAPSHSAQVTDGTSPANIGFGMGYSKEPTINIEPATNENPTVPTHISSAAPKDLSAQSAVGSYEISDTAIKIMDEIKRNIWRDIKGIAFYVPSEIIAQVIDCAIPYLNKREPNPHREFCVKCQELLGWKTELVMGNISYVTLTWLRDMLDNYCPHVWNEDEEINAKDFKAVLDAAGVKYVD